MVVARLFEFPADVREAGHGCDVQVGVTLDEGAVGAEAVALEVAVEGLSVFPVDEDGVEAGVCAAFVPVVEDAVFGVVTDPEVAGGGFAVAGFEATDGGASTLR